MSVEIKKIQVLETILSLSGGTLVLYIIFRMEGLLYTMLALIFCGLFIFPIAKWITFLWMKLAEGMGAIMSKIILSIVFFIFLTPIAMIQRLLKKNTIQLNNSGDSMYSERKQEYTAKDFEKPW